MRRGLRIYDIDPPPSDDIEAWAPLLTPIADLGFDLVHLPSVRADAPEAARRLRRLAETADAAGLGVMVDLALSDEDRPDLDGFGTRLRRYADLGVSAFQCLGAWKLPGAAWRRLIDGVPEAVFCAETFARPPEETLALADAGFHAIMNSVRWWDGGADWFLAHHDVVRRVAPTIGSLDGAVAAPGFTAEDAIRIGERRYLLATAFSSGVMMPAGLHLPASGAADRANGALDGFIAAANRLSATIPALADNGPLSRISAPGGAVQIYTRWNRAADDLVFILVNLDPHRGYAIDADWLLHVLPPGVPVDLSEITPGARADGFVPPRLMVGPGDIRLLHARPMTEIEEASPEARDAAAPPSRVVIERVAPMLDGGQWPVKRIVGDMLEVSADIFRDGHDKIAAALRLREAGRDSWRVVPMLFVDNDRWAARIRLQAIGHAEYTVDAWTDPFASWRDETMKKRNAGRTIALELAEGRALVLAAIARAEGRALIRLETLLTEFDAAPDMAAKADLLTSRIAAEAMALAPDKADRASFQPMLDLVVDRVAARFGAWYEMFPRSQGSVDGRSASFADCAARLPEISRLGFDVVYLVPIHPIGRINRKGRHNSLAAGPEDPGSPYAIGSAEGGHTAIHPDLGTIEDFRAFQRAVRAEGMELALDFAVQCAPDHPWLTEHPGWFRRRADGSIRHAENPPKTYEDIVNIDFDHDDWQAVWQALRAVILFWVEEGVRIFRVDNPHTKPVAFWRWLIAEVKAVHPDVLFLAEAFTRPKMMRYLAKIGFSQSYTYFTWRTTKAELTAYLGELTEGEARDYFRPNFFANTPDILPYGLQTGGRASFLARLVLAATLSPTYGLYNGFELCEATAVPGKEEYADSEKYAYKVWDWDRAGHLKDEIARLNRLRHACPAFSRHDTLAFHDASHPEVLFYARSLGADRVFVVVHLNPTQPVETEIVFPFGAEAVFETEEVLSGDVHRWTGARHRLSLDPAVPALVLRLLPPAIG